VERYIGLDVHAASTTAYFGDGERPFRSIVIAEIGAS
jgi:hypothetical protein